MHMKATADPAATAAIGAPAQSGIQTAERLRRKDRPSRLVTQRRVRFRCVTARCCCNVTGERESVKRPDRREARQRLSPAASARRPDSVLRWRRARRTTQPASMDRSVELQA